MTDSATITLSFPPSKDVKLKMKNLFFFKAVQFSERLTGAGDSIVCASSIMLSAQMKQI